MTAPQVDDIDLKTHQTNTPKNNKAQFYCDPKMRFHPVSQQ